MTGTEWAQRAYGYSKKSQPNRIATEATELLELAKRILYASFQVAARVNWTYFGKQSSAITYSSGWALPSDMELLAHLTIGTATGTTVYPVAIDESDAEPGSPTAYRMGPVLLEGPGLTDSSSLVFHYSRTPEVLASMSASIDAEFPTAHEDLLILEMAMYLALKDGRNDELGTLQTMRDRAAQLFVAHLQHSIVGIPRTWFPQRFQGEELSPLLRVSSTGEE